MATSDAVAEGSAAANEIDAADLREWRCFHCDEVFTTVASAREHFGDDCGCEPACKIDIAEYRRLEAQQRACVAECCEEAKRYWAAEDDRRRALVAEEQKGFDRGIAGMRAELAEAEEKAREWKEAARRSGICMACALGTPEPYGCAECLNTGWAGGSPPGSKLLEDCNAGLARERDKLREALVWYASEGELADFWIVDGEGQRLSKFGAFSERARAALKEGA